MVEVGIFCSVGQESILLMISENTVAKTKTHRYGFLHKPITIQLSAHVKYHEIQALLITLLNSECPYAEFPSLKTEQELRGCAKTMQDVVSGLNATLDGASIPNLEK